MGVRNRVAVLLSWMWRYLGWPAGPQVIVEDASPCDLAPPWSEFLACAEFVVMVHIRDIPNAINTTTEFIYWVLDIDPTSCSLRRCQRTFRPKTQKPFDPLQEELKCGKHH